MVSNLLEIVTVISVLAIPAIVIISIAGMVYYHRIKRMKIEAALREEEMRRGYMPGTYSRSFSSKKAYKEMQRENRKAYKKGRYEDYSPEDNPEEMDREELEKAINDLERRINNLDTIMKERRR